MSKWRSLSDAFRDLKAQDPGSSITLSTLRELVRYAEIPSKRIGRKYFVRLEDIESWFIDGGTFDRAEAKDEYIRRNG